MNLQKPLAEILRPVTWDDFSGLEALDGSLLQRLRQENRNPPSLIFWGPPGTGKTTIARLIAKTSGKELKEFSAVLGSIKEVKELLAQTSPGEARLLFVDEIHRFNKSQQDAFLPYLENGSIIMLGATTENPSFYLNSALISRCKLVHLKQLENKDLKKITSRALSYLELVIDPEQQEILLRACGGDARQLLNQIEFIASLSASDRSEYFKNPDLTQFYDRSDQHYNFASAFIKSLRGSDPDAALFYGFKMLESGEDPRFIFRRLVIFASEDIGNADPKALQLALAGLEAFNLIGLPEGKIPLSQVICYLACAPKSNRSYLALHAAEAAVKNNPAVLPPKHILNAPTKLMRAEGYGAGYQYPHDYPNHYIPDLRYLPEGINPGFYKLSNSGYEAKLKEFRKKLKTKDPE